MTMGTLDGDDISPTTNRPTTVADSDDHLQFYLLVCNSDLDEAECR